MIDQITKRGFSGDIPPPIINSFSGNIDTLYWSTSNAITVSIDQGVGFVASSGSVNNPGSYLGGTTNFTLTASANGLSVSASIAVATRATCYWATVDRPERC